MQPQEYLTTALAGLKESLAHGTEDDVNQTKQAIAKYIGKLVLTPTMLDGRPVYKVSGNITIPDADDKCRMQVVARDGIEPPTPAFSGLRSTN